MNIIPDKERPLVMSEKSFDSKQSQADKTQSLPDKAYYPTLPAESPTLDVVKEHPSHKAVILLFLSPYKHPSDLKNGGIIYQSVDGTRHYCGISTADAPLQYLMDTIRGNGDTLWKILCIVTDKVGNDKIDKTGATSFSRFRSIINDCCTYYYGKSLSSSELDDLIVKVPYEPANRTESKSDTENASIKVFKKLTKSLGNQVSNVYIDFSGGLRDGSFLMTSIIRFLEFTGHPCRKIIYSNLFDHTIYEIDYIYKMFQMINGTEEFISSAQTQQLSILFADKRESDKQAQTLIKSLQHFSEIISLNKIFAIDEAVKDIADSIQKFQTSDTSSLNSTMLKFLIPAIQQKMKLNVLYDPQTKLVHYPTLIRWCLDHRLIQQALTLYVEKMPVYYFEMHVLNSLIDLDKIVPLKGETPESHAFYTTLYESITEHYTGDSDMSQFVECLNSIKDELNKILLEKENVQLRKQTYHSIIHKAMSSFLDNKPEAEHRLFSIIRKVYPDYEARRFDGYEISYANHNIPINQNTFDKFLNNLIKDKLLQHYILLNQEDLYSLKDNVNTYKKKLSAIQYLIDHAESDPHLTHQKDLSIIMTYYLAAKILRNRINHAGEDDKAEAKEVKDYISALSLTANNGSSYTFPIDDTVQGIQRLLNDGLKFSESLNGVRIVVLNRSDTDTNASDAGRDTLISADPSIPKENTVTQHFIIAEIKSKRFKKLCEIKNLAASIPELRYRDYNLVNEQNMSSLEQFQKGGCNYQKCGQFIADYIAIIERQCPENSLIFIDGTVLDMANKKKLAQVLLNTISQKNCQCLILRKDQTMTWQISNC